MDVDIKPAGSPADLETAAQLFRAYAASLGVDLGYQDFATELATLPGKYAPPAGVILLARDATGAALGCIALRPMQVDGRCEMKRLFVPDRFSGHGTGRRLCNALFAAGPTLKTILPPAPS